MQKYEKNMIPSVFIGKKSYLCSVKKMLTTLLCTLALWLPCEAQVLSDGALRDDVKTVQLYCTGSELEAPVLNMNRCGRLQLEFDVLRAEPEELRWRILHCDRNWQADSLEPNEFMSGFESGTIDHYTFSFTTLRDYVHYEATVPEGVAEFTYSGNYVLEVTTEGGEVLLRRRFQVTEQSVKVEAQVTRPHDGVEVDRRQEVDVKVSGQWPVVGEQWIGVMVQQNGRIDNMHTLEFSGYEGDALTYRHKQNNIFYGGNTFRFFDCSNMRTPMYNVARIEEYGGEVFALLRAEENRSKKHYLSETTLNGGMKVNVWDRNNPRLEADYVWVNFSFPMEQPLLEGSLYIVGALTNWRMDSTSRMEYNPRHRAYTKRLLLKQGYYAYQVLVAGGQQPMNDGEVRSRTAVLEGDHRETPNRYTVCVYQRSPSDLADRLMAVVKIP